MVEIAAAAGTERNWLELLPRHLNSRRARDLEQAIEHGLHVSPHEQPHIIHVVTPRPTENEKRRFEELVRRRDAAAQRLAA